MSDEREPFVPREQLRFQRDITSKKIRVKLIKAFLDSLASFVDKSNATYSDEQSAPEKSENTSTGA